MLQGKYDAKKWQNLQRQEPWILFAEHVIPCIKRNNIWHEVATQKVIELNGLQNNEHNFQWIQKL